MGSDIRKYGAEAIGTFVLVIAGVGSAVIAGDRIGALGVAIAFGLSLLAMAYAIGPVSGCHINPAVTFAMLLTRKISARDATWYVAAQVIAAIAAAGVIAIIAKGQPGGYDIATQGLGANGYGVHSPGGYDLAAALVVEVVLTAILVFTVLGATDLRAPVGFAGIPIGLALTLVHLVGIPVTNMSVNPARSIGPALFVGGWAINQLWLFVIAPIAGAVVAAGAYAAIKKQDEPTISIAEAERSLESEQAQRIVEAK